MHQTFAGRPCLEPGNKPRNSAKKSPGLPVLPRTPHPDLILPQLLPAGLRPPDLQTPHPPAGLCSTPVFVPCFQSRWASGSLSLTSLSLRCFSTLHPLQHCLECQAWSQSCELTLKRPLFLRREKGGRDEKGRQRKKLYDHGFSQIHG
nr:uncharacterized protein LOC119626754 [Chlorocebus sabaeus]